MPIGKSFWFERQAVYETVKKFAMNLDEFLTGRIAAFLLYKKPKSKILVLYGAIKNRFVISVCSPRNVNFARAFRATVEVPGYLEVRHDFLLQTSNPFILYDGDKLYRLYNVENPHHTFFYVCDFRNVFGRFIYKADKKLFFNILNDKDAYFDYSAVPKMPVTEITYQNSLYVVHHAFCKQL
jgi:hypothetical protein